MEKLKSNRFLSGGILAIVNLIVLGGLIFLLNSLPKKALEIKTLRSLKIKESFDIEALKLEVESSKVKFERLKGLFPDESGLVDFVTKIDGLKRQGVITSFAFASNDVLKDRAGFFGIPVIIEFRGDWNQINQALKSVENLPYLLRTVEAEIKHLPEENLISFRYGGFLYVSESFNQD